MPIGFFPRVGKANTLAATLPRKMTSHKQNGKPSCQVSECLAMFPTIRHFIHSVAMPKGHKPEACQAFLAMAAFIDQAHDGNQAGLITRTTLLPAVEQAIQTFHQAFPEISLVKKWHWQFHMPDTLQRFGFLPSCFANERKHKPIGALAQALLSQKKLRPTCWSKPLPKRSAIWTQQIFSKMVSIWFAQ